MTGTSPGPRSDDVPEAAVDAYLDADTAWAKEAHPVLWLATGREQARAGLEAAAPVIAAVERERIAARMDELAGNYPEDVFPPDSDSRDGISGTAMRHAYQTAARTIREEET